MLLNGERLVADVSGGLYWPGRRLFAVADLHLEKGSAHARFGSLLPPYDSRATVERLEEVIARLDPETVICLGDSFHDPGAGARLDPVCRDKLRSLRSGRHWFWVAGNHDPEPPRGLGGACVDALAIGALGFRHEPGETRATGEVCGHLHPCASVTVRGRGLRRRCFVGDGTRLVLPAFGAYAGGLDVHEDAIRRLFPGGFDVWLLGRDRVRGIGRERLSPPRRLAGGGGAGRSVHGE